MTQCRKIQVKQVFAPETCPQVLSEQIILAEGCYKTTPKNPTTNNNLINGDRDLHEFCEKNFI